MAALLISLGVVAAIAFLALVSALAVGAIPGSIGPFGAQQWDPILEPYVEFVETERELKFDHPVDVRFADIAQEVTDGFEAQREAEERLINPDEEFVTDPYGDAYHLLGLVELEPDADSQEATEASIAANAGAFYDGWFEEIVLPEGESQVALQVTIVHELTHALQHQNGMLDYREDTADGNQARLAVIEGDAERIAEAWFVQLTPADQEAYLNAIGFDPEQSFSDPGNSYLDSTFFVSYGLGVPMVRSIIETDGLEEVNRLLVSKDPGTTERFIDVLGTSETSSFNAIAEIDLPDVRDEADGDLGMLTWFSTLAPIVGTEGAFDALVGYDDDAFAIYDNSSGKLCGRFDVFFDNTSEASEFADIAAVAGIEANSQPARRSVTMDICDPIGNPMDQKLAVVFPLIVVNELVLHHLVAGLDDEVARCAAIDQAKTLQVDQPLDSFVGYDVLFEESSTFVGDCR